jgi:membrane protease YdiL (CAAX protease family)
MNSKTWTPWLFFIFVYALNFLYASKSQGFPFEEALGVLIILGIFFSVIAFILVRKNTPLEKPQDARKGEGIIITGIFILISVSLIFGNTIITAWLPDSFTNSLAQKQIITLVRKVIVFVVVPFFAYRFLFGFNWNSFGFSSDTKRIFTKRNMVIFTTMALLFILLQWFGGRAAEPIRLGKFTTAELIFGMPLSFLWLFLEVGLVEEFFFRGFLQNRISVLTGSSSWGIVISCLLFGLAHAPGMYFREAGMVEGLGANPSFLDTISYSIAVQSTAGLPFAIIWSKTRNIWLVMSIHAAADLLSNYPELMKSFYF